MVNYTATATPSATLTATPATLTAFATTTGTPSTAQTYALTGSNLTADVLVTPPAGYEVAQGSPTVPGTYAGTQTVAQADATAGRTIYVRLTGAAAGTFSGNVLNTSTGATAQNVAVSGTVTALGPSAPSITGFSPVNGPVGTIVTVTGTDFTGATAVRLNNVNVSGFTVTSATTIEFTVLAGATSGRIVVVAPAGFGTSANNFTVDPTPTPGPTLTVTPAVLTGFSTTVGTASAIQQFTLTGTNLSSAVAVTPPSGYEVAVTAGGTYRTTALNISQANATAGQLVFVRLAAATPAGTYGTPGAPLFVVSTATGAAAQNVAVDGVVAALTPAIAASPASLAGFSATVGTASPAQSYTLTPTALAAPITATAPAGYEVSLAAASGYAGSVTASQTAAITIYVRLAAGAGIGAYSGTVANTAGSVSQDVAVSGAVSPIPTVGDPGLLVLEEDFAYPTNSLLSTVNTEWKQIGGTSTTPVAVSRASLGFPQYGSPASLGGAAALVEGQDVSRAFTVPAGTTDYYLSALVQLDAVTADYFLGFSVGAGATSFPGRIYSASAGAGQFRLGVSYFGGTIAYSLATFSTGTPYLVALRYTKNPGATDDRLRLYVFDAASGTPLAEPAATATADAFTTTESVPAAVFLRQNSTSQNVAVDGIRAGTGWGAVVGRPVYTAASAIINPGYYYDATVNNADLLTLSGAVQVENALALTSGRVNTTATNLLTLGQAATTSGGSAASFVNGPLARVTAPGAAITAFPVGKGTAYRPLTLTATAQASTTIYTAQVFNASARTTGVDSPLDRVSNIRYATITPDAPPTGFSGTLTLAFGLDDYVTDPQDNTLVVAKRTGTANWASIGRSSATGTAAGGNVAGDLTSGVFTSFSDFALASTAPGVNNVLASNPLPVELTAFSAQRQPDNTVVLQWNTASEQNSARFDVQRSLDGREYSFVASAAAQGSSTQATAYAASDKAAPAARLYYRLRQVDGDGTSAFSPVATVASVGITAKPELYPNPAHRRLNFVAATATSYHVLNQLGQSLLHGTTEVGAASIALETLPAGLYFLELQTPAARTVLKFEKQ